jgi:glycerophosphoryl diester phosphodiesterase
MRHVDGPRRARLGAAALGVLTVAGLITTGTTGASAAATVTPATVTPTTVGDYTRIGHRGFPRSGHTENTRASFDAALRQDATAVETDLHLTADQKIVLMHDARLDRTTTCTGPVHAYLLADLLSRCRSDDGQPVMTLDQLLAWGSRLGVNLLLELKADDSPNWSAADYAHLAATIGSHRMLARTRLLSYSAPMLDSAEEADPRLFSQWIALSWPGVARAVENGNGDGVNVLAAKLTPGRVRRLHDAGLQVVGRNTDRVADWAQLRSTGADGLLTDALRGYRQWWSAQA